MSRMVRAWSSVAVALLLGAPLLAGCSDGPNPFQAAAQSTTTTVDANGSSGTATDGVGDNVFLPEGNISNCVGALERPNCGSPAKGTKGTYMVFAVLILGLAFIFWRVARGVKARDAAVNGPKPTTPGPAAS
jgi:hypothetical protein